MIMRRLIIIAGISGAGKSYLLEQLSERSPEMRPIKKYSTRSERPYEKDFQSFTDLYYGCTKKEVGLCDYKYNYCKDIYGIKKEDIDNILSLGKCPVVIIRKSHTIKLIKEDYPDALVIFVKTAYTGKDLIKILEKQGRTDIEIEERMDRHRDDLIDYANNLGLYDYVFTNLFDGDSLIAQFDTAIRLEIKKKPLEHDLIFVLMSFNPDLRHIFDEIEDSAKLVDNNIRVIRIDNKKGDYSITPEILKYIEKAKLIVCDLTEERPSVYYELGYARGKEKVVIHCAKEGTKLHFDVKDNRTIFYKNPTQLRRQLIPELKEIFNYNINSQH